jgi:hypothetical protein
VPSLIFHRLNEATFIELVLYDDLRSELLRFLGGGSPDVLRESALLSIVAGRCQATPEQLRHGIAMLEAEDSEEASFVLRELLCHRDVPEDVRARFPDQPLAKAHVAVDRGTGRPPRRHRRKRRRR